MFIDKTDICFRDIYRGISYDGFKMKPRRVVSIVMVYRIKINVDKIKRGSVRNVIDFYFTVANVIVIIKVD